MNQEIKKCYETVEDADNSVTVKEWVLAAEKVAKHIHSLGGNVSESTRFFAQQMRWKVVEFREAMNRGLPPETPYFAVLKMMHSHWILHHAMEKADKGQGVPPCFQVNLHDHY